MKKLSIILAIIGAPVAIGYGLGWLLVGLIFWEAINPLATQESRFVIAVVVAVWVMFSIIVWFDEKEIEG